MCWSAASPISLQSSHLVQAEGWSANAGLPCVLHEFCMLLVPCGTLHPVLAIALLKALACGGMLPEQVRQAAQAMAQRMAHEPEGTQAAVDAFHRCAPAFFRCVRPD